MGNRIHIRIDTNGNRRDPFQQLGPGSQTLEFRFALNVETADAEFHRQVDLGDGLADTGKHSRTGRRARRDDTLQFPARDDVEARPEFAHELQHAQIRIRLDGITDLRAGKGALQGCVLSGDDLAGIDISRRADGRRNIGQGDRPGVEHSLM